MARTGLMWLALAIAARRGVLAAPELTLSLI
jgi:hypothetical protein